MSVDSLQEKIRKMKNPTMLHLCMGAADLPEGYAGDPDAYARALLTGLKDTVPAVRVSFTSFAIRGAAGLTAMDALLRHAKKLGYYVLLDAPELLSPGEAAMTAEALLGPDSLFLCDGLVISGYCGSDVIRPFLPYCREEKKDLFVVARTANKSAPELQDLLAGGRLVHAAAADHVNRYGGDTIGRSGYSRVGILAAASAPQSMKELRGKYPKLFMVLDGADYSNASIKGCANGFDRYGHGAAVVIGSGITEAWKQAEEGTDPIAAAQEAALRFRKNLSRYVTVL